MLHNPQVVDLINDPENSSLWMSYNRTTSYKQTSHSTTLVKHILSFHFTQDQSTRYQAFRLVIVAFPETRGVWRECQHFARERPVLFSDYEKESVEPERTLNITLLIPPSAPNELYSIREPGEPLLRPITSDIRSQSNALITVYDKHYHTRNGALSQLIALDADGLDEELAFPSLYMKVTQYSVSICQTHRSIKAFPTLPRGVARMITAAAADNTNLGTWAHTVASCALISKSWFEAAYSLIWINGFSDDFWRCDGIPNPVSWFYGVVQLMLKDPESCASITKIPSHNSMDIYPEEVHLFFQAWEAVCSVAVNVQGLQLVAPVFTSVSKYLTFMHQIETFEVTAYDTSSTQKLNDFSIIDVLCTASGWVKLKELKIIACANSTLQSLPSDSGVDAPYSLTKLTLERGEIYGPQLLQLVTNSSHTLKYAHFEHLKCLTASAFRQLFQLVSGTIETLRILNCPLEDAVSTEPHEGLALDLTISDMKNLKDVIVQADLASNLSIARATPPSPQVRNELSRLAIMGCKGQEVAQATDPARLGLVKAIRQASWSVIFVLFDGATSWGGRRGFRKAFVEARQVAKERSIKFKARDIAIHQSRSFEFDRDSDSDTGSDTGDDFA